ncbi:MAG TPA: hypothetical protein PKA00_04920 [Saprospiraceae bacterium]|nr:hypothetical protein [Saprospiraceae bacterium]HMQ82224.1 hypothetical protein [Saprospiraceae bacterium]
MKKLLFTSLLMIGASLLTPLLAQQNKVEGPLNSFVNTDFMLKFKDLKIEAEAAVRRFKLQSHELLPEDVQAVQTGYEQSAYRFNQLLYNIKDDFLNSKKLKYISAFPEDYLRTLELELHQLSEFYAIHFLQPMSDATGEEVDGSPAILLIVELVGLTKGLIQYFGEMKQQSRHFNEAYLNEHLIQPFAFRTWDEIGAEGTFMPSPAGEVIVPDLMEAPSLDPLLNEASDLLQPVLDQTDNYDETETYDDWLEQNNDTALPPTISPDPIEVDTTQSVKQVLPNKEKEKSQTKSSKAKEQL